MSAFNAHLVGVVLQLHTLLSANWIGLYCANYSLFTRHCLRIEGTFCTVCRTTLDHCNSHNIVLTMSTASTIHRLNNINFRLQTLQLSILGDIAGIFQRKQFYCSGLAKNIFFHVTLLYVTLRYVTSIYLTSRLTTARH